MIGYLRVSSFYLNETRQFEELALDRTFVNKASGKDMERPQLAAMLHLGAKARRGALSCEGSLGRNLDDSASWYRV